MGRDGAAPDLLAAVIISIHSPRMGRDKTTKVHNTNHAYFNPLSPHGERLAKGPEEA